MEHVPWMSALTRLEDLPGHLPNDNAPEKFDLTAVKHKAVSYLNDLQKESFSTDVIWRDLLIFTETYRTFNGIDNVVGTLDKLSREKRRSVFKAKDVEPRFSKAGNGSWYDVDISFTIQEGNLVGCGDGTVSVTPDETGRWKVWMLRTWQECWDGYGHPDHPEPNPAKPTQSVDEVYGVIVVGGGQAGLSLAGRLKALGISHLLFESNPHIGDQWLNRYDSLRWHTLPDFSGLPFGYTYKEDDEEQLPTKRIAAGHKEWSENFGLNIRTGTKVDSAAYDEASQIWSVQTTGSDEKLTWKSKNLVICIGNRTSTPISPSWASQESISKSNFAGTVLHSAHYHNAHGFAGKHGVVVGTANTGHDVAEDMANEGMSTTIIQRSPTFIFPFEWLQVAQYKEYNRSRPVKLSDRETYTYPHKIMRDMANSVVHAITAAHPERFDALERAGFRVDRLGDISNHLYNRSGGHYVDIGASKRIAEGEIKVKSGVPVKTLTKEGILFEDGSEVKADLIVLATGFEHDFRKDAGKILGEKVAGEMDEFWGMDPEGEIRGFGKLAGHPQLYYFGGDTRMARFFSSFVALQIQKEMLGYPLRPYKNY